MSEDFLNGHDPMATLTARQYAAIKLRVPDSGLIWLDGIIEASLRDELAAKAVQGSCANHALNSADCKTLATWAYDIAGAMLRAREQSQ